MPLEQLAAKGFVKSKKVYTAGMRKGNDNIANQVGAVIQRPKSEGQRMMASSGGGCVTLPNKDHGSIIMAEGKTLGSTKLEHQAMIRHELFETMEANRMRKDPSNSFHTDIHKILTDYSTSLPPLDRIPDKTVDQFSRTLDHSLRLKPILNMDSSGGVIGSHFSNRVLTRESEIIRKNPYLSHVNTRDSLLARHRSRGEDKIITRLTGKRFGEHKMTSRDHNKALNAKPDGEIDAGYGVKYPLFQAK